MQHQQHPPHSLFRAVKGWYAAPGLLAVALLAACAAGQAGQPSALPPTPPPPSAAIEAELGVPLGAPLLSVEVQAAPLVDGLVEAVWDEAPPLHVPLHRGLHGTEPAGSIELRSLHDAERVYFLARWPSPNPGGEPEAWRNLLTVHWRLLDPGLVSGATSGSQGLRSTAPAVACTVACHTATADGLGRLVGVRNETIPPGLDEDLLAAGGWSEGNWTVEWSRLRLSDNPYDQRLTNPARGYRFFVKLFVGEIDGADPVSDLHELRLGP